MATHKKSGVTIIPGDTVDIFCQHRVVRGVVTYADCNEFADEPNWSIELRDSAYWKQQFDGGHVELVSKGENHKKIVGFEQTR